MFFAANCSGLDIKQNEYDHMEGTDFTKKVSKIKLDRAKKRQSKMLKKSKLLKNQ